MITKKYITKNKNGIKNTFLWDYLKNIENYYKEGIQSTDEVEKITNELEGKRNYFNERYIKNNESNIMNLKNSVLEKRLLNLDDVITEINTIQVRFENDEENLECEDEEEYEEKYDEMVDDLESDVIEALLCII